MNVTARFLQYLCGICISVAFCASSVAQSSDSAADFAELQKQLDAQARQIEDLQKLLKQVSESQASAAQKSAETKAAESSNPEETDGHQPTKQKQDKDKQYEKAASPFGVLPSSEDDSCTPGSVLRLPLAMERPVGDGCGDSGDPASFQKLNFYADYDNGFQIR